MSANSDTPRTKAARAKCERIGTCMPAYDESAALERELAAAKEALSEFYGERRASDEEAEARFDSLERKLAAAKANGAAYRNDYLFSQDRLKKAEAERDALREALGALYDKWEEGDSCHEYTDGEPGAFLGKAFRLSDAEEDALLALIGAAAIDAERVK